MFLLQWQRIKSAFIVRNSLSLAHFHRYLSFGFLVAPILTAMLKKERHSDDEQTILPLYSYSISKFLDVITLCSNEMYSN